MLKSHPHFNGCSLPSLLTKNPPVSLESVTLPMLEGFELGWTVLE